MYRWWINGLEWSPLSGCGTQHPHRALGGACVLLAAAPTTPPCFRHWRRSSSLLSIFSGKNIYNFAILENLRIFQNCLFTGGVVKANGICSAAFCESAALRLASSPSQSPTVTALPKGEPLAVHANFIFLPRPLPLGEVDATSGSRRRERGC